MARRKRKPGRPKEKPVKILPYKQVLRQLEAYKKEVAAGKSAMPHLDDLYRDITSYLKKDGTPRASSIKSNKKKRHFNKLIQQFKKSNLKTMASREKYRTNQLKGLQREGIASTPEEAKKIVSLFASTSIRELMNAFGLSSEDVLDLNSDRDQITVKDFEDVAKYIITNYEDKVPDFLYDYLFPDGEQPSAGDIQRIATTFLDVIQTYDITTDDITEAFRMASEEGYYDEDEQRFVSRDALIRSGEVDIDEWLDEYFGAKKAGGLL